MKDKKKIFKTGKIIISIIVIVALMIGGGFFLRNRAIRREREALKALDNIDIQEYLPFRAESKIARLPGTASLQFTEQDNLPALDGAAALFPVYSAYVNAIYPDSIPMPGTDAYYDYSLQQKGKPPFQYHNTVLGYSNLAHKENDIFFGVAPSDMQRQEIAEQGGELQLETIGYDAFVFFVNSHNPIDSLTQEQIRQIYAGEIINWQQLGGPNMKIYPYQRNQDSGSQTALENFMGDIPLMHPPVEMINSLMSGIIEKVADYDNTKKGAIGFSFRYYTKGVIGNDRIKLLKIDGVEPSVENITNRSYPIVNELYAAWLKDNPNPNVQLVLDWVLSEEGQYLLEQTGYVPVK